MGIGEIALEAFKVLIPPKGDDMEGQTRWRWVVFASIVGMTAALGMHIALACGYLPALSSGFALASDQKAIQRRIDVIATLSLEHEIRSKTLELCTEKDAARRAELNSDIGKLQWEYREVAGGWYAVPSCDRL